MTYKGKLMNDHPDWNIRRIETEIDNYCPHHYFKDASHPKYCKNANSFLCADCWGREIVMRDEAAVMTTSNTIKDSGDRTEFITGAVRDMREGKGRCDLMPLEVISDMLGTKDRTHDPILLDIATFMYETNTCWLVAALNNFAQAAYDDNLPTMLLEVAKHFEDGAKKYGESNWQRGIPVKCYIDSAVRHYLKWLRGDDDEPHNRAFVWNLLCCIWEVDYGKPLREAKTEEA